MVHQVFLDAKVAAQEICEEQLGEGRFVVKHRDHGGFSMSTRVASSIMVAVAMHTSCPARHATQKKLPAPVLQGRLLCLIETQPRA